MFYETQLLIHQLKLDKHILILIKDFVFLDILTRDKNKRTKERNLRFGRNRTMLKILIKEQSSIHNNYYDDTGNLPLSFYINIDNKCDALDAQLHETWMSHVENEIAKTWNYFEGWQHRQPKIAGDIGIVKRREISYIIRKAKTEEDVCWTDFNAKIQDDCRAFQEQFVQELVPFGQHARFMYLETRDVYFMPYLNEGAPYVPGQYLRIGMMKGHDIECYMKWSMVEIMKNNASFLCSIDPVTQAIYKVISLENFTLPPTYLTPLFGVIYKGETLVF